jgi:hypothetical protein
MGRDLVVEKFLAINMQLKLENGKKDFAQD